MGKVRQSNIELMRIIAMFMILVIHANMIAIPRPTSTEIISNPMAMTTRFFIESFGIVGVDIFILISGWFLINTRVKSFLSLGFQVLSLWGGTFLLFFFAGKTDFSIKNLMELFMFTKWDWFVKSYVMLMILAPVLNTFVKNSPERLQRYVLGGFFTFSSTYGWLGGANRFFVYGYGPLLFIGLYLLAQYVHHSQKDNRIPYTLHKLFNFDKKYDLLIFFACIIVNTLMVICGLIKGINIYSVVYAYTNPITIVAALFLLLFFSKLEMRNSIIVNTLAAGSFAVYLLHSQVDIRPFFNRAVLYLYNLFDSIICLLSIFAFLVLVYLISVAIDYPRLWMWNKISNKFNLK